MRRALGACGALVLVAGCGIDPFGSVPHARTHGYRAHGAVRHDGVETARFELAVRGEDIRREDGGGVLLVRGREKKAFRLDPGARNAREVPFVEAEGEIVPGAPRYPLVPGFDHRVEAQRRGLAEYHRESDEVFAGHACALWRFDDAPNDLTSPATTYWVAPDLDNLVVRLVREVPKSGAPPSRTVAELTDVRVGAAPALFAVPTGHALR